MLLSSIQNTLPTPTVLSTLMAPANRATNGRLTTKPMPVPSSMLPTRLGLMALDSRLTKICFSRVKSGA